MQYNALEIRQAAQFESCSNPVAPSMFMVMPRQMYFGELRATSIDLCVRDLLEASKFLSTARIFTELIDDPFPGFDVVPLPVSGYATTFVRSNFIANVARRERPQVIVVQQHLASAAAIARRLPKTKVILYTHNFQKSHGGKKSHNAIGAPLQHIRRNMRKYRYSQLAGIIHVSKACEQRFAESWSDVAIPSCVINNGLDFDTWRPAQIRSKEILFTGRCAPEKGVLEAAQALAGLLPKFPAWQTRFILSDIHVHPDYFSRVQTALSVVGDKVSIETQRPFAEIKEANELAAIVLVPSKWIEPFGRTALEAHAGGAALISSGTGGLAEISGEAALMLPSVTIEAISNAVETLITDEALRERLARDGATRVRSLFGIKTQAALFDAFCSSIILAQNQDFLEP